MIKSQPGIHIWENQRKQYSFLKEITEQLKKENPLNLKVVLDLYPPEIIPPRDDYFFLIKNSKTDQWSDFLKYIIWNGKLKRVNRTIGE